MVVTDSVRKNRSDTSIACCRNETIWTGDVFFRANHVPAAVCWQFAKRCWWGDAQGAFRGCIASDYSVQRRHYGKDRVNEAASLRQRRTHEIPTAQRNLLFVMMLDEEMAGRWMNGTQCGNTVCRRHVAGRLAQAATRSKRREVWRSSAAIARNFAKRAAGAHKRTIVDWTCWNAFGERLKCLFVSHLGLLSKWKAKLA